MIAKIAEPLLIIGTGEVIKAMMPITRDAIPKPFFDGAAAISFSVMIPPICIRQAHLWCQIGRAHV